MATDELTNPPPDVGPAGAEPTHTSLTDEAAAPPARKDSDADLSSLGSQLFALVTTLGPPLTIATALLFYFGWVRTSVEASTLGADDRIFGYSAQDYVIRSISTLFWPIVVSAGIGIGALLLDGWLVADPPGPAGRRRRALAGWVARCLLPAFALVPAIGWLLAVAAPVLRDLLLPLSLAVGIALTAYAASLRQRLTGPGAGGPVTGGQRRRRLLVRALVTVLVALALFWEVGNLAAVVGRGLAYRVAENVDQLTGVVVYSEKDLQITATGVRATRLHGPDSAYAYRYDGLRLLERTGGRLFLLPSGWTLDHGTLIVIPDDGAIRVEYTHGR
jgi:hypothetical protein